MGSLDWLDDVNLETVELDVLAGTELLEDLFDELVAVELATLLDVLLEEFIKMELDDTDELTGVLLEVVLAELLTAELSAAELLITELVMTELLFSELVAEDVVAGGTIVVPPEPPPPQALKATRNDARNQNLKLICMLYLNINDNEIRCLQNAGEYRTSILKFMSINSINMTNNFCAALRLNEAPDRQCNNY